VVKKVKNRITLLRVTPLGQGAETEKPVK